MQTRAGRGGTAAHEVCHLVGGVAFHVVQVHHSTQVGRERADGVPNSGAKQVGRFDGKGCVAFLERLVAAFPA